MMSPIIKCRLSEYKNNVLITLIASTSCANLPSYLMESSNFNGADGTAVKARCKLGKIFNSTAEENTVCSWNGGIPQKIFPKFASWHFNFLHMYLYNPPTSSSGYVFINFMKHKF